MQHLITTFKVDSKLNYLLTNEKFGKKFLILWAMTNDMNILGEPLVHKFPSQLKNKDLDGGYSGAVLLSESHVSIHSYPEEDLVYMDLFSCKELDVQKNRKFIQKSFRVKDQENFKFEIINR